jgi:hypothetical protein
VVLAFALTGVAACSNPKSFVVVVIRSGEVTPIRDVTQVVVDVTQGTTLSKTLTYPPPAGTPTLTIDQVTKTDLSIGFTGGRSGTVTLAFTLRNAAGCTVGKGMTTAVLKVGSVATAVVDIFPFSDCAGDGGASDAAADALFPGCDPVAPACGAGKTCQVNCESRAGECITGGTGAHGTPCLKNNNCMAGTQCFDYGSAGCNVKLCLRFCNDDGVCQAAGDGGAGDGGGAEAGGAAAVGTRSVCAGPVQCGAVTTAYHTCTFACDPRQVSVASSGCPTGLTCLIVGNMDQVDCACAEPTRTGTDNTDCTSSAQCAPGFVCNMMGGSQKCRAVCRCNANGMTCTAPNDCTGGRTCSALTNNTTFGACL